LIQIERLSYLYKTPLAYIVGGGLLELAALRQYIDHVNGGPPSRESYSAPAREG